MSPVVFISHSSEDRRIAGKVCDALERRGLGCWIASRDIGPGENFQEAIVGAIRSVRTMVLVFTGSANNSSEIKKEIALASQNHLAVIPLRVEDVLPSDAFVYELSTRQWIDAFDDWDRAMGRLVDQIGASAGVPGTSPVPIRPPPRPSRARTIAVAAALVVLAGAGALAYRIAGGPAAPAATPVAVPAATTTAALAAKLDISGKWLTEALVNPYDANQRSTLHFQFDQSGESLFGTVNERAEFGGAAKGIQDGAVKDGAIVFYTQGLTTTGSGEQPYKERYRGTVKGTEIEFIRQNDAASAGYRKNSLRRANNARLRGGRR